MKPLPVKSYGSIPHLPGSRQDRDDIGIKGGQADACTIKPLKKGDVVYVEEKLDGSNVSIAKINGELVPLVRAGYSASSSKREQHQLFVKWVECNVKKFSWLQENQRICGEWLSQVHGTRYMLKHDPFVAFDIITNNVRENISFRDNFCLKYEITLPFKLHQGSPLTISDADKILGYYGYHNADDEAEGAVWRVERKEKFMFIAKFVRKTKIDGKYFGKTEEENLWNWHPTRKLWWQI